MTVLTFKSCVGADGVLRLEIPTEYQNTDLEVCTVLHALPRIHGESDEIALGYPEGFFERTAGQWQGEFERPDQGVAEERAPL